MNKEPIISARMMLYGEAALHATYLRITLKYDVEPDKLQQAVDEAVRQCPWVTYGVIEKKGLFYFDDSPEKSIRIAKWDEEAPPALGSSETQWHMFGVFYKRKNLYFSIFHGLTDAGGVETFAGCTLGCYNTLLNGESCPKIRTDISDQEAEPFNRIDRAMRANGHVWGLRGVAAMFKKAYMVWNRNYAAHKLPPSSNNICRSFFISADAGEVMNLVKEMGIKTSALFVSLYMAAFLQAQPDAHGCIKIAMPVDYREILGIPDTFRDCTMPPAMFKTKILKGESFRKMAVRLNRKIKEITQAGAKLNALKEYAVYMNMFPKMSYEHTEALLSRTVSLNNLPFTFVCSYAHRFSKESYLDIVEKMYVMNPPYGTVPVFEIIAMPDRFYLSINQNNDSDIYARALVDQFRLNGISAVLEESVKGACQRICLHPLNV